MLGNDVVDLEDPETRPETFRPRFDQRVFDDAERRAIAHDPEPHARRWAHWAAKEAAYKLARQIDPRFVFSPKRLVARFAEPMDTAGSGTRFHGTLALPHALAPGLSTLELRGEIANGGVHVAALPQGEDWDAVVTRVETLTPDDDPSAAVRRLARDGIAADLGVEPERVTIGRRGRIPTVEIDGRRCHMGISLSHHGRFLAFATSHHVVAEGVVPEGAVAEGAGVAQSGVASDRELGVA